MKTDLTPVPKPTGEVLLYQTEDGSTRIEVRLEGETVWLPQKAMADLFQKDVRTVSEHIRNLFDEGELAETAVVRKFRITAADGKHYDTQHYNLDVIISVGYRVKSQRGTQFRIWATQRLREYLIKGFTMDDERLTCTCAIGLRSSTTSSGSASATSSAISGRSRTTMHSREVSPGAGGLARANG